jgi:hypothetical protein
MLFALNKKRGVIVQNKIYKTAIYLRLSREDFGKGNNDSDSIKNQRSLLTAFCQSKKDLKLVKEFVDECLEHPRDSAVTIIIVQSFKK